MAAMEETRHVNAPIAIDLLTYGIFRDDPLINTGARFYGAPSTGCAIST
jgi:hypothetical protein